MRLLRYKSKDPTVVDPHWDFEHEKGRGYDTEALRLWRTRVFLSGPGVASIHVRLARITRRGAPIALRPEEHVYRFIGGAELAAQSYARLESGSFPAGPPMLVLAVNLSRLPPGEYALETEAIGRAQGETRELRFQVSRRALHTWHDLAAGHTPADRPSIRSTTGLLELEQAGVQHLVTAHRWSVFEHSWPQVEPGATEYLQRRREVFAVTLFRADCTPEQTRWRFLDGGEGADPVGGWRRSGFELWQPPGAHANDAIGGPGLPFPILSGLPRQPDERGSFELARRRKLE